MNEWRLKVQKGRGKFVKKNRFVARRSFFYRGEEELPLIHAGKKGRRSPN